MLDVSEILYDPDFNQSFIVNRKSGSWDHGHFVETENQFVFEGVVLPASAKEIQQVPEGDRIKAMMVFYSDQEMFVTHADNGQGYAGSSDVILWRGENYRIVNVNPYGDYGYFKAVGVYIGRAG